MCDICSPLMLISKTSSGRGELEKLLAVKTEILRAGKTFLDMIVLRAIVDAEREWEKWSSLVVS